MNNKFALLILIGCMCTFISCHGQNAGPEERKINRLPAVAGSFYPAEKKELEKELESFFRQSPSILSQSPQAIIVPHAGYVFSGQTAAVAFRQLDRNKKFQHIFIIASSHTMYFNGVATYTDGNFVTPLGEIPVDSLTGVLTREHEFIFNSPQAHAREHSIEVQLPFLQYWLTQPFSIVPLVIGSDSRHTCRNLAKALQPYFNAENLFIISSDFSHYPSYDDAIKIDRTMAEAIMHNSADSFLKTKQTIEGGHVPNLATAVCGWTSVLTLLYLTENNSRCSFQLLQYKNSGDSPYGEKDRVVGYNAIAVTAPSVVITPSLTREDKVMLLKIARETLVQYLHHHSYPVYDEKNFSPSLLTPMGAFVSLHKNGELRGCIGNFEATMPLYRTVESMAVAAATEDFRFPPVTPDEITQLEIEISILTPMRRIYSIDEFELGRHGIYIRRGNRAGTFLPQVAKETGWSKEEFLGHCARDKALIGWDGWKEKDTELYVYEAVVFSEKEFNHPVKK